MKSNTVNVITAGSMTGTATITSASIPIDQLIGIALQAVWTGTPNGTIKLQGSVDGPTGQTQVSNGGPDTIANWTDISDSSYSITGVAGNFLWDFDQPNFRNIRVVYTNTSSTGTLNVKACLKGI